MPNQRNERIRPTWRHVTSRFIIIAILWWALTEGDTYNLWVGVLVVIIATVGSLALQPVTGIRPWHIGGVLLFFVRESVSGGIDVARRAFSPKMPIDPGIIEIPLRLPEGPARVFLANLLNITPGTVSVELQPKSLRIHMLDVEMPVEEKIREMEELMARLFNVQLDEHPDGRIDIDSYSHWK